MGLITVRDAIILTTKSSQPLSSDVIRRALREGRLKGEKPGGLIWLVDELDLERFLEARS